MCRDRLRHLFDLLDMVQMKKFPLRSSLAPGKHSEVLVCFLYLAAKQVYNQKLQQEIALEGLSDTRYYNIPGVEG